MKRRLFASLALTGLLLTTAPAMAQRIEGTAINYGGITIPVDQARPPAGYPHIAFRPRCDQLTHQMNPDSGMVLWGLAMPDGHWQELRETPALPQLEAWTDLAAAGICKFGTDADGAVRVPVVYSDQVPQTAVARPVANPVSYTEGIANTSNSPTAGMPLWLVGLCAVVFGVIAIAAYKLTEARYASQKPPTATRNPDGSHDPFEEI